MENNESKHITSNVTPVFLSQALIAIAMVLVVSFAVFLIFFNDQYLNQSKILETDQTTGTQVINAQALDEGIDETDFVEGKANGVESSKLENLFPVLKN